MDAIDIQQDISDYSQRTEAEKKIINNILRFFAQADEIAIKSIESANIPHHS